MNRDLREVAKKFKTKLDKIKVVAFDVDGILTDSRVWYSGEEMGWNRCTDTSDGYGLRMLKEFGFKVGVITGGDSLGVTKRFKENLKLDFVYSGNEDKRDAYKDLLSQGYKAEEILFMGDEFFDLPLLMASGFSATVPNTSKEILDRVDYVTSVPAPGAAREVIDILRYSRDLFPKILDMNDEPIVFS